jgi:hypothetical protein
MGCEWSASRPSCALPPGKGPPVPIVQEAGWAQTQMLEEKSLASAEDRTSITRSSSPQPDTILTEIPASCSLLYLKLKLLFVHSCHCEWLHRCTVHTVRCLRCQTLFFLHLFMCHSCTQSAQQVRRGCRPLCMTRESPHPVPWLFNLDAVMQKLFIFY